MVIHSDQEKTVLAIIGDPVSQVKSPKVFGKYFKSYGIHAEMFPLHVHPSDFEIVMTGLRRIKNFAGAIITIPHKSAAYNIAAIKGYNASTTETANVLIPSGTDQWSCEMFDGIGLITAIKNRKLNIEGMKTLVIGAGGAGTAISVALRQTGNVGTIGISDPNQNRAIKLVGKLGNAEIVESDTEGYELIVNASPVGMGTQEMPIDLHRLSTGIIVCDAIMHPRKTKLLVEAEKRRCIIIEGIEILQGQLEPLINFLGLYPS